VNGKRLIVVGAVVVLVTGACGAKKANHQATAGGTLTLGASMSLTGSLAREGALTKEGYQLCQEKVNARGGVPVGGKKVKLAIRFQDDTSKPDTAA
jgi:branched-chain amino acid transport system substrate-binding protein